VIRVLLLPVAPTTLFNGKIIAPFVPAAPA